MGYYKRYITVDHYALVLDEVNDMGKRTRKKVKPLMAEAHKFGVLLGLSEALNVLRTQSK